MRVTMFVCNDTATTEIYTLALHDALPISASVVSSRPATDAAFCNAVRTTFVGSMMPDAARSSRSEDTRLNSSHANISYAVFCLKKKTVKRELLARDLGARSLYTIYVHTRY